MGSPSHALRSIAETERDQATAVPLRSILGYTPDDSGHHCQNLDASTRPVQPPCSADGSPAPARWVTERRGGYTLYLCNACVPRCVHDGLPRHAYDHIAGLAALGWRSLVVEDTRNTVSGIQILSTNPVAQTTEPPPDVQASLRRYVYWRGSWIIDHDQLRGCGVIDDAEPSAPFGAHTRIDRGLLPQRVTTRAHATCPSNLSLTI